MLRPMPTRLCFQSGHAGFTTLELMVVVAIVGVMSALGISNFGVWKSRADLKEAITVVQHELALARMTAISRNLAVTANIAVAPTVVTVTTVNTNTGAQLFTSRHPITHVNSIFSQLTVGPPPTWTQVATTNVTFNAMGFRVGGTIPGTQNQVIAIDNDRLVQYTIQITPRGAVTWCAGQFCQGTH